MDLPDDAFLDWDDLGASAKAKVIKRIKELVSSGAWSKATIDEKVSREFNVKVPMSVAWQTLLKPAFFRGGPFEKVEHFVKLGQIGAAIAVLGGQPPTAAYRIIRRLLLRGKIKGHQAISLITQSVHFERWHELGIESVK
jgi:hypothetical protein